MINNIKDFIESIYNFFYNLYANIMKKQQFFILTITLDEESGEGKVSLRGIKNKNEFNGQEILTALESLQSEFIELSNEEIETAIAKNKKFKICNEE